MCGVVGAGIVLLRGLAASSPAGWHQRQTKIFRGAAIGTAMLGALVPFVSNGAHAGGFVAGALVTAALGQPGRFAAASRSGRGLAAIVASAWLLLGGLTVYRVATRLQVPAGLRHAQYLEASCDAGDAGSCFAAGVAYHLGKGVPQLERRASQLYQRGCDGGNAGRATTWASCMRGARASRRTTRARSRSTSRAARPTTRTPAATWQTATPTARASRRTRPWR